MDAGFPMEGFAMNFAINKIVPLSLALLLPLTAASAEPAAAPRPLGVEASITFPSDMTIKTWQADGEDGIWVQDQQRNWYYGTFFGPCRNLDFALGIGIDNRGTSQLDKYAAIRVGRERCQLMSFVTSAPPPTKAEKKAAREAEKAARAAEKAAKGN